MTFIVEGEVEEVCLDYLRDLGYDIVNGPDIAPDGDRPERAAWSDVILRGRLAAAVAKLNPRLPPAAVEDVVARVLRPETQSLISENWRVHDLVTDGVPVEFRDPETNQVRHDRAWLIDFADPFNNDLLAVNQFTVKEDVHTRRPDVVIFVNGLPLGLIELKNPGDENATLRGAFNQIQTYKNEIPGIFVPNAVCVVSDGVGARMGSLTAGWEHFAPWRTVDGENLASTSAPQLDVLVAGVFDPVRFLDLVRNFIAFQDEQTGLTKKVAKYHQYWSVNAAVQSTIEASTEGDGRAGVVWHTQGSGKSLEMLFYAQKVMRHPYMRNPTLVLITDRNDLDSQLHDEVFAVARTLPETPVQADSREHLRELLQGRASGGIVFTTIQKFGTPKKGDRYPLLSDRSNIVVVADEAHRSQYDFIDGFARNLRDGLPNASFLGFTGTPIESSDKSTRQVFGDYVSIYDLTQAVEDGATVRIFYESRLARLDLPETEWDEVDAAFDEATEAVETPGREKLKSKWARIEAIVGSDERVRTIARDVVEHFEKRTEVLEGKCMVVCMSRRICAGLYAEIIKLRPAWHSDKDDEGIVKAVFTGSAADPQNLQPHIRNKERQRKLKLRAKDPDDPLRMVIVRDMWLTGFDSPSMHTMYIDKPMTGHNLMQAIARINRTFRDKPAGLVVDYIGIADALRRALADYTDESRKEAGIPIDVAVGQMKERYEVVTGILHGHDWSGATSPEQRDRLNALASTANFILGDEERKKRFLEQSRALVAAFALCVPHEAALAIRYEVGFFQDVRSQLLKLQAAGGNGGPAREDLDTAINQIVSGAVAAGGVIDIYDAAGLSKPDLSILSDEFLEDIQRLDRPNLQMEVLRKLLNDEIRSLGKRNIVAHRKFSEMLNRAILAYQNRALTSAEVIQHLVALAKEMRKAHERGEELGLGVTEVAFYDAVAQHETAREVLGDDTLRLIARELVEAVKGNVSVDWSIKETARARLRAIIRRLLLRHGYPPDGAEEATLLVLEQAELFAAEWEAA